MMRQAGRYLPEYRQIRTKYSFKKMMSTPDLASEITLHPIRRFQMDAAILFSDILVIPESLGCKFDFIENKGPVFETPIRTLETLNQLNSDHSAENIGYVYQTIRQLKPQLDMLNTPLIGFAGAPFTVASYMIEGGSSSSLKQTKLLMAQNPGLLHQLLEKITTTTINYLNAQIENGVDALQLFDTWAGLLSWDDFKTLCFPYIKTIIKSLKNSNQIPITLFCKNTASYIDLIAQTGCTVISVDWTVNLTQLLKTNRHFSVQGNLDPHWLYAPKAMIRDKVQFMLSETQPYQGYIFNLGHGLMPDIDPDAVKCVVDTIKQSI